MAKTNYSNWNKEDLIKEVELLKKRKTYGLVWEEDKTKEVFDYYINWDGEGTKENFGEEEGKFPVLKEVKNKSIDNADPKYNILIEGDNYHSLAVLNFTHNKAVDVIYIDPPYNTGNKDFKYNDAWVDKEDSYRHSKYLSFMSKRLKLARNLLKDTGVIFISIDDNEQAQLRILCNEVFGENNFITQITREAIKGGSQSKFIRNTHDYILVYSKNINLVKFSGYEQEGIVLNLTDEKGRYALGRELNKWGAGSRRQDAPSMWYPISAPNGEEVYPIRNDGSEGGWRLGKKNMLKKVKEGDVIFKKRNDGTYIVYEKMRDDSPKIKQFISIFKDNYINAKGTEKLKKLFNSERAVFDYSKPVELILDLMIMAGLGKEAIILDFFAGSGTTGHAVCELNKEDGGNRKFILCTNNENNICVDVCYPRIKKVIEGYNSHDKEKIEGLGGNLKYFKTDFVDSTPTDANKRKIVDKSTDMLCIKENAFKLIKDKKGYKIFKNTDIHLGIIFDEEEIKSFVKDAKEITGKFHVYVFSFDDSVPKEEFEQLKGKVKLCPIPEVILHVYRRIFR